MLLAHDLGTTGDKASLHDDDGRLLASCTAPYDTDYGPGGRVEQDPHAWWEAFCAATRQLLSETGTPASAVSAVSFSGQMMGATLLDADHEPVRPSLIWADTRSGRQADEVAAKVGEDEAYRILGHRLNPTYTLTKTMWVRDHEPEVFARVRHVCAAKDYLVWRLTGRLVTDPSDASAMNAFDQHERTWSTDRARRGRSRRRRCSPRSCPRPTWPAPSRPRPRSRPGWPPAPPWWSAAATARWPQSAQASPGPRTAPTSAWARRRGSR